MEEACADAADAVSLMVRDETNEAMNSLQPEESARNQRQNQRQNQTTAKGGRAGTKSRNQSRPRRRKSSIERPFWNHFSSWESMKSLRSA